MIDDWPDEAARAAYFAGLHGAKALIVERANIAVKSHSGVQRELARLTRGEAAFDRELRGFLGRAFNFKTIADYDTEAQVTTDEARTAIQTATRLVDTVTGLMPPNGPALRPSDAPKPSG